MTCQPAATNLCTNPSMEVDLTGWSDWGSPTRTRDTGTKLFGTASQKIVMPSGETGVQGDYIAGLNTETFTYSVYGLGAGNIELGVQLYDAGFGSLDFVFSGVPVAINASTWTRIVYTFTITNASADKHRIIIRDSAGANTFYMDGVQCEKASAVSNYFDGSFGTGYAWTGSANASTSTRSATADCTRSSRINTQFQLRPY